MDVSHRGSNNALAIHYVLEPQHKSIGVSFRLFVGHAIVMFDDAYLVVAGSFVTALRYSFLPMKNLST